MLQESTSKFDFTRRGEHAQEFSYTQGAARRTELRRLQAYVKMSDYMVCDALQEVGPCRQLQTCCPSAPHHRGADCTATVHSCLSGQWMCTTSSLWSAHEADAACGPLLSFLKMLPICLFRGE